MVGLISTGSNYIFMIMCAVYAVSCFTVFLPTSDEVQDKRMNRQQLFMFIFHFICYGVLFLKTQELKVIFLYVGQAVFIHILLTIYKHLYSDCSRIMMNNMCFLLIIGFVMLTRIDFGIALRQFIIVIVASLLCLVIPFFVNKATWIVKLRWVYGIIGFLLLASVFVIGSTKNGSTNWISFGGFAIQPMEFVKIAFVFFLASVLQKATDFKMIMITSLFAAAHVMVLILERDLGGALLYFVIYMFMCYVATCRIVYIGGGLGAGILAGSAAYKIFAHVRARFAAWHDPWSIIQGRGYQITQSLFAIGTGGWVGLGLTQGRPTDIPVVESDFIFSAIAEEFGVFFAICLIFIYLAIFIHFLQIAMDVRNRFYKLTAYGFAVCFIFQVFLNIGGVTKFIPSTGVTLPLISYGGSSITSTLIIFAIMQGIFMIAYKEDDDYEREPEKQPENRQEESEGRGVHYVSRGQGPYRGPRPWNAAERAAQEEEESRRGGGSYQSNRGPVRTRYH